MAAIAIAELTQLYKMCPRCVTLKAIADFAIRRSGPRIGQATAHCKRCCADSNRKRSESDDTFYRRVEWPSKLKQLYGITVEDYNRMLAAQGGGCAVCGSTTPNVGNRGYTKRPREVFDVDHCHATGTVRGLLCTRCNRLVGLANDSLQTAQKLVEYLSKGA